PDLPPGIGEPPGGAVAARTKPCARQPFEAAAGHVTNSLLPGRGPARSGGFGLGAWRSRSGRGLGGRDGDRGRDGGRRRDGGGGGGGGSGEGGGDGRATGQEGRQHAARQQQRRHHGERRSGGGGEAGAEGVAGQPGDLPGQVRRQTGRGRRAVLAGAELQAVG